MQADLPPFLYKYMAPQRLDALARLQLRYTPLGAFNDPFEGRPEITGLSTPNETISIYDKIFPEEVKRIYDSLPSDLQASISYSQLHFLAKQLTQGFGERLHTQLQSATPQVIDFLTRKVDQILGALCLSEVPDSLLMWSHYGVSHTGFVLEFDSNHTHFHEPRSPDDDFRRLRRVFYREARPSSHLTAMSAVELFLVKSGHWAYEREWRIVRPLSEADAVVEATPYPIHLFSFPPSALTAVVIGARATSETAALIRDAVASAESLQHVRIRQAVPDSTHFHLRVVDGAA